MKTGATLWFTGLSGAGKTTLCRELASRLKELHQPFEHLDGDEVRQVLTADLGFSLQDRMTNMQRVSYVCQLLNRHQVMVLASFITPHEVMREYCRSHIANYIEIYVKCPLGTCIERDVKGLYSRALRGEIPAFTGISDPFEEPLRPDLVLETDSRSTGECVEAILLYLREHGYIEA